MAPFKGIIALLAFLGVVAAGAAAQTEPAQPRQEPRSLGAQGSSNLAISENIVGATIQDSQGEDIGEIESLIVDEQSGRVAYAVLGVGGIMGVGERAVAIPWAALTRRDEKVFTVQRSLEELQNAPEFNQAEWEQMADRAQWEREVESFYMAGRTHESGMTARERSSETMESHRERERESQRQEAATPPKRESQEAGRRTTTERQQQETERQRAEQAQRQRTEQEERESESRRSERTARQTESESNRPGAERKQQESEKERAEQTARTRGAAELYDPKKVESVRGTVARAGQSARLGELEEGVQLQLRTESGETALVYLAPKNYLDQVGFDVKPNTEVSVKGSRVEIDGKEVILASEVTFELRDENGEPAWKSPKPTQQ